MKTIAVLFALVAVALAAPQHHLQQAAQRQQDQVYLVKETPSNNIGLDQYQFGYELSDGQKRDESAQVETQRLAGEPEPVNILRVRGSFSFVGEDGQTYTVNYTADETGFHPEGTHLPVAPVA